MRRPYRRTDQDQGGHVERQTAGGIAVAVDVLDDGVRRLRGAGAATGPLRGASARPHRVRLPLRQTRNVRKRPGGRK